MPVGWTHWICLNRWAVAFQRASRNVLSDAPLWPSNMSHRWFMVTTAGASVWECLGIYLGQFSYTLLGAAFDTADYSFLLQTLSSLGFRARCSPGIFSYLSGHSFAVSYAGRFLCSLTKYCRPSSLCLSPLLLPLFVLPVWLHPPPYFRYHLRASDSHIFTSSLDLLLEPHY